MHMVFGEGIKYPISSNGGNVSLLSSPADSCIPGSRNGESCSRRIWYRISVWQRFCELLPPYYSIQYIFRVISLFIS